MNGGKEILVQCTEYAMYKQKIGSHREYYLCTCIHMQGTVYTSKASGIGYHMQTIRPRQWEYCYIEWHAH